MPRTPKQAFTAHLAGEILPDLENVSDCLFAGDPGAARQQLARVREEHPEFAGQLAPMFTVLGQRNWPDANFRLNDMLESCRAALARDTPVTAAPRSVAFYLLQHDPRPPAQLVATA